MFQKPFQKVEKIFSVQKVFISLKQRYLFPTFFRKRWKFKHANSTFLLEFNGKDYNSTMQTTVFFDVHGPFFFLMPDNSVSRSSLCHANASFFSQFQQKELMTMLFFPQIQRKDDNWTMMALREIQPFLFSFSDNDMLQLLLFSSQISTINCPKFFFPTKKKEVKQMTIRF